MICGLKQLRDVASDGGVAKFATLNDMDRRSSSEEEEQAFYAGGSERSGH